MIDFECPSCGRKMHVPESAAGKKGKCKTCGTAVIVPAPISKPPMSNRMGIGSVILGVLALLICWVPLLGFLGKLLSGLGLLLAAVAVALALVRKGVGRGFGITGSAICAVSLFISCTVNTQPSSPVLEQAHETDENEMQLPSEIAAAEKKIVAGLPSPEQISNAKKKCEALKSEIQSLRKQNATIQFQVDELAKARPDDRNEPVQALKSEAEIRIELVEWKADRDTYLRLLDSGIGGVAVAIKVRVTQMRERALQTDNYPLALAILEENKNLLNRELGAKVTFWRKILSDDPDKLKANLSRVVQDAEPSFRQNGQDRIAIEIKSNAQ